MEGEYVYDLSTFGQGGGGDGQDGEVVGHVVHHHQGEDVVDSGNFFLEFY